jgi:4-amino-4-deoxy-L-arabinose transferase-like glycosyltransferase
MYAQIAREIIAGGDWLTLHYEYKPWFEKPPLLLWSTAVFYELFGVNEFWSRAASAFSGIGIVIVTYLVGKLIYDPQVGFLAVLSY